MSVDSIWHCSFSPTISFDESEQIASLMSWDSWSALTSIDFAGVWCRELVFSPPICVPEPAVSLSLIAGALFLKLVSPR